ncbi:MAG: CCA tRNA nucleotidyltransferase [Candidatus Nanohaloarchaea archaeon]
MNWERLRAKVLEEKYPTEEELEETREKYEKLSSFIREEFGLKTHFAGSAGRGTCVAGDKDIDLFVLFPEDTPRRELEEDGLRVGKAVFEEFDGEHHVEYAEHPYTKGEIEGHEVEVVPCIDTDPENIKSSVDRTPHHSRWAKENLNEEQKKDVVLLKTFLGAEGIYGSSLKTEGFSGYLSEILIAHYGSFRGLTREAKNWPEEKVIDPEGHHDSLPEELEEKFERENLVVVDPVDPERNVASVLSRENYARFIYRSWAFENNPGVEFFQEPDVVFDKFELEQEIDRRAGFLVIEFENPDEVDDVVYPQLRKVLRRLRAELERNDFQVFQQGVHQSDLTRIFFELERELPEVEHKPGPRVFHGIDHLEQFTQKYENVFVEGDRLYARIEREHKDAKEFLKQFLDGDKKELQQQGIPNYVAENLADYSFTEPLVEDEKWLKYLAEKLHVADYEQS